MSFSVSVSVLSVRATKSSLDLKKASLRVFRHSCLALTTCHDIYLQPFSKRNYRLHINTSKVVLSFYFGTEFSKQYDR